MSDDVLALLSSNDRRWMERRMRRCRFVEWDRFTVNADPEREGELVLNVYGWIDRPDDYKDFVHVTFWTGTRGVDYITSSDEYTLELYELLIEEEPEDHAECRRVEHTFNVSNAVELTEDRSLEDYA